MSIAIHERITVSQEFRDFVLKELPVLKTNIPYFNFVQYLMFPKQITPEGFPIINHAMLRKLAGYKKNNGTFKGIDFLKAIKYTVLTDLQWSDYSFEEGRARVIVCKGFSEALEKRLTEERANFLNEVGTVYFISGHAVNRQRKSEHRMYDKSEALNNFYLAGCDDAKLILEYLNHQPPNRFTMFVRNMEDAVQVAQRIEHEPTRNRQLDILRSVTQQPMPYYKPTNRTVRISSSNDSVLRLKRDVRKAVTKGLVSLDINHAQISIAAKLWSIPSVQVLLRRDINIWQYLMSHLVSTPQQELKDVLKKGMYALMYGMSAHNLIEGNATFDGLRALLAPYHVKPETFMEIDIMKDILDARKQMYGQIAVDNGARDHYGRFIWVEDTVSVASVAAQVIQSYELALIAPIYRAANLTNQWYIVLHLHDGVFVKVRNLASLQYWVHKLNEVVMDTADQMGIYTSLSAEQM